MPNLFVRQTRHDLSHLRFCGSCGTRLTVECPNCSFANQRAEKVSEFLEHAYKEMMRKYEMIPKDSSFRKTYLENIQLHKEILTAYQPKARKSKQKAKPAQAE